MNLEEELRVVGENLKALEVAEEKAQQREEEYKKQVSRFTNILTQILSCETSGYFLSSGHFIRSGQSNGACVQLRAITITERKKLRGVEVRLF